MAMKQLLRFNNIDATYWRIVGYNVSISGKMCQIFLCGYDDEIAREENRPKVSKNYMITSDKFDKYVRVEEGLHVADLYGFLRHETDDFEYAVDLI